MDFARAGLIAAVLAGAVLVAAVLAGAVLVGAVLVGAVLVGAVLAGVVLAGVVLAGVVLAGALVFIGGDFLRFLAGAATSPPWWAVIFFAEGLVGEGTVKTPGSLAANSMRW